MTADTLYYAFSTIAQCAAALAALIGFLGLWRLDRLREQWRQAVHEFRWLLLGVHLNSIEQAQVMSEDQLLERARWYATVDLEAAAAVRALLRDEMERQQRIAALVRRCDSLSDEQQRLMGALPPFLLAMLGILCLAIGLIPFAETLSIWVWPMRAVIIGMSLWLGCAPAYVVIQAAGGKPAWQRHWSRRADQMQQAWNRARQWHGPALVAERLRGQWCHMRHYWSERGWPTLRRWGTQARTRVRRP